MKRLAILTMTAAVWTLGVGNAPASAGGTPLLVEITPITVPIVGSGRIDGSLRVKVVLSARDPTALARLNDHLPELRAATVAGAIEFARLYASTLTPVDAVRLRTMLTATLHAQDDGVADALIVEVSATA